MFIKIDNLNINYISEGEGEKILLLHGWGTNIKLFSAVISHLKKRFNVIAPDFPGFGESDEPSQPWSVDDYADFVLKFCSELNITRCYMLAHSFGGRVIIKLFSRPDFPLQVDKIVLTGSAGIKPKKSILAKSKIMTYKIGKNFLNLPPIKKIAPNALDNFRRRNGSADYNAASPVMRQTLVKVVNEDLVALLPNITASSLLIWGENDDSTPLRDGKLMEKLIPDAGLVIFENSGHFAYLEQNARFCRVLDAFL